MAQTVKHLKTSAIPDGSDVNQVQPSDWNADHVITGSVDQSQVTNLVPDLALKAPLASPAFTGNPTAPTPTPGDSDTSIATTDFVSDAILAAGVAPIAPGYRNLIINGDFVTDQRYNGAAIAVPTAANTYLLDRWVANLGQSPGALTVQRLPASPTGDYAGQFLMLVQPSVADTTLATTDHYRIGQNIEGHMMRGSNWGGSSARQITISFVCDHIGGPFTLSLCLRNGAGNRSYVTSFVTGPTRQSITIPGDTTGTWLFDTGVGLRLEIGLGLGTSYHVTPNTWGATGLGVTGMSNFMANTANQLYFKEFQVELGAIPTEFERLPQAELLLRCQRYYIELGPTGAFPRLQGYNLAGNYVLVPIIFPTTMRAVPTVTKLGTWHTVNCAEPAASNLSYQGFALSVQVTATGTVDSWPNTADDYFTCNAEL